MRTQENSKACSPASRKRQVRARCRRGSRPSPRRHLPLRLRLRRSRRRRRRSCSTSGPSSRLSSRSPSPRSATRLHGAYARRYFRATLIIIRRLQALNNEEAGKRRREEARNSLEAYLYKLRDLLEDDNPESAFHKCSQEPERKRIAEKLKETSAWISDHGDDADTNELVAKLTELEYVPPVSAGPFRCLTASTPAGRSSGQSRFATRKSRSSRTH